MINTLIAAILVAGPGSAIAAEEIAVLQAAVDEAERKWRSAIPAGYSYHLIGGGPFGYTTYMISVDGDECRAKSRLTFGRHVTRWKRDTCEGQSIASLFGELRRQLSYPQERIELIFDSVYGYPKKVSFQPYSEIEDQSEYFEMQSFKVRRLKTPDKSLERTREE